MFNRKNYTVIVVVIVCQAFCWMWLPARMDGAHE